MGWAHGGSQARTSAASLLSFTMLCGSSAVRSLYWRCSMLTPAVDRLAHIAREIVAGVSVEPAVGVAQHL